MEIHEITRLKSQKLDEVNFSAIPGALGGIVKQAIMSPAATGTDPPRVGPMAAIGQEKTAANAVTNDLYAKAAKQADQNWRKGVMTQLANFKYNTQNWNRTDIETMLRDYVQNRLLPGQQISDPKVDNQIRKIAYKTSSLGSLSTPADMKKWDQLAADWPALMTAIRDAQATQPVAAQNTGVSNAPGSVSLNPATQAIAQTIAPYTTSIARLLPSNYNSTQISPTNNSSVNAILANLGLLKGYKPGTP